MLLFQLFIIVVQEHVVCDLLLMSCMLLLQLHDNEARPCVMGIFCCRENSHPAALPKLPFALTWWEAVWVLTQRQWKLTVRDASLVRGRIIQVSVQSPS